MGFTLFLFVGLAAAVVATAPDMDGIQKQLMSGDINVQVSEKAGRMKIWRTKMGDGLNSSETTTSPIFVLMDELTETDSEGNPVGVGGQKKHSFKTFATQDFAFSDIKDDSVVPNSDAVKATSISYSGQLKEMSSTFKTTMYIAKTNGTISLGNSTTNVTESYPIREGQVKFTVELNDWEFCADDSCKKGEVGEYIDFTISLQIPAGRKITRKEDQDNKGKPEEFNLGLASSNFKMSKLVRIDDVWEHMPEGYPKYEMQGASKHLFTIRISKFTSSAFYDPSITLASVTDDNTDVSGAPTIFMSLVTMVAALMFGAKLL